MRKNEKIRTKVFNKKIFIYGIIITIFIAILSATALTYDFENNVFDLSRLKNKWFEAPTEILYKGDNIILYRPVTYDLFDSTTRDNYTQTNLGNLALCLYANRIGIEASEDEITEQINYQREIAKNSEEMKKEYSEMFEIMGVTEEEYWNSDLYRKLIGVSITVEKLLKHQEEIIIEENKNNPGVDINEILNNWRLETIEKTLREDNVKKVN